MRAGSLCVIACLIVVPSVHAQSDEADPPTGPVRTYSLLRENENWSFLKDPSLRNDFWDPIKYIRLRADNWYLTVGGEIREVFENVGNDNWGKQPYMNTFFLQRYMLNTDWHLGKQFRVFVQLKSGLELYRQGGPRPIDEKKLDFEAAYVEIAGNSDKKNWIVLRAGRQELNYGSGRLLSVREGPNVRQSFDGVKIRSKAGAWNIDAFAVRPDLDTRLDSSTTLPIIKPHSGGSTPRGPGIAAFPSTRIIWEKIARARPSIGEQPQNFGIAWQRGFGAQSRGKNPVGILMMRLYGNLGASAPALLHPRLDPVATDQGYENASPICP